MDRRTGEWEIKRTYWECIDEKCPRNHSLLYTLHRVFCGLQELVLMGFDIQTVRYIHDQRAGHTWENRGWQCVGMMTEEWIHTIWSEQGNLQASGTSVR